MPTAENGDKVKIGKPAEDAADQTKNSGKFGAISYDTVGTYKYEIREVIPEDKDKLPGVSYDDGTYTATVTVSKDEDTGELTASVGYKKGDEKAEAAEFTNTFIADTSITFEGTKTMENGELDPDNPFTFNVYQVESTDPKSYVKDDEGEDKVITTGTTAPADGIAPDTAQAIADAGGDTFGDSEDSEREENSKAEIRFGEITYTLEDLKNDQGGYDESKEFIYEIREVIPDTADENGYDEETNIQYDKSVKTVRVTLTLEDDELKATAEYETDPLEFTNAKKYTRLLLNKTVTSLFDGDTEGEKINATLVFKVTYSVEGQDNPVVRYMSVQYDASSETVQGAELEKIPFESIPSLKVEEVYSGNYEGTQTSGIEKETIDGEIVYTVSYANERTRTTGGSGIINKYTDGGGHFTIIDKIDSTGNTEKPDTPK